MWHWVVSLIIFSATSPTAQGDTVCAVLQAPITVSALYSQHSAVFCGFALVAQAKPGQWGSHFRSQPRGNEDPHQRVVCSYLLSGFSVLVCGPDSS